MGSLRPGRIGSIGSLRPAQGQLGPQKIPFGGGGAPSAPFVGRAAPSARPGAFGARSRAPWARLEQAKQKELGAFGADLRAPPGGKRERPIDQRGALRAPGARLRQAGLARRLWRRHPIFPVGSLFRD